MEKKAYRAGVDVGSTTLKVVAIDNSDNIVFSSYRRHKTDVNGTFLSVLEEMNEVIPGANFSIMLTGTAGMGIAERLNIPFSQEVIASIEVIKKKYPSTKTLVDLGGEDAKIVFFQQGKQPDIRMNGSCAGGTGAFIDQMADLMNIDVEFLGNIALKYNKIYPVASRCGVFAKTDVQNLISRNIPTPDLAMSILHTVAIQAITTLARGHKVDPPILCIGGPLTFIPALRKAFATILNVTEKEMILPKNGEFFPALGCAMLSQK